MQSASAMAQTQEQPAVATPTSWEQEVEVPNPQGIHARPATLIAKVAGAFKSQVTVARDNTVVNAKSTLQVLTLVAEKGARLVVRACGEDAQEAVEALVALVRRGFDEM